MNLLEILDNAATAHEAIFALIGREAAISKPQQCPCGCAGHLEVGTIVTISNIEPEDKEKPWLVVFGCERHRWFIERDGLQLVDPAYCFGKGDEVLVRKGAKPMYWLPLTSSKFGEVADTNYDSLGINSEYTVRVLVDGFGKYHMWFKHEDLQLLKPVTVQAEPPESKPLAVGDPVRLVHNVKLHDVSLVVGTEATIVAINGAHIKIVTVVGARHVWVYRSDLEHAPAEVVEPTPTDTSRTFFVRVSQHVGTNRYYWGRPNAGDPGVIRNVPWHYDLVPVDGDVVLATFGELNLTAEQVYNKRDWTAAR